MSNPGFTITNNTTRDVSIDTKFSEDRQLRVSIPRGQSFTIQDNFATVDELDRSAQVQQLIADGDITIAITGSQPRVGFTYTVVADAATGADTLTLQTGMPFAFRITGVTAFVSTGVATSTVTLASAATGGQDYTAAIATSGTAVGVAGGLTDLTTVARNSNLVLNRSATGKAAHVLVVEGLRTEI